MTPAILYTLDQGSPDFGAGKRAITDFHPFVGNGCQ